MAAPDFTIDAAISNLRFIFMINNRITTHTP